MNEYFIHSPIVKGRKRKTEGIYWLYYQKHLVTSYVAIAFYGSVFISEIIQSFAKRSRAPLVDTFRLKSVPCYNDEII